VEQAVLGDVHARPDGVEQRLLAERPALVARQQREQIEGLGGERDLGAVGPAQAAARRIQRIAGEAQHGAGDALVHRTCRSLGVSSVDPTRDFGARSVRSQDGGRPAAG
jgi:hypothetical protein